MGQEQAGNRRILAIPVTAVLANLDTVRVEAPLDTRGINADLVLPEAPAVGHGSGPAKTRSSV